MTQWRKTVDIKKVISAGTDAIDEGASASDVASRSGKAVADLLKPHIEFAAVLPRLRRVRSLVGFNAVLAEIYDIADAEKIWLGL